MADFREITGSEIVPLIFRLRYDVWCAEGELKAHVRAQGLISDEHDEHARHWAAFDGDEMIAAARMCIHKLHEDTPDGAGFTGMTLPPPIATINRLVVSRNWRRLGIARQLDVRRIQAARDENAACLVVCASGQRIASLQALGFKLTDYELSSPFMESLTVRGMILTL